MANYFYSLLHDDSRPGNDFIPAWKSPRRTLVLSSRFRALIFYGAAGLVGLLVQSLVFKSSIAPLYHGSGLAPPCNTLPSTSAPVVSEQYTRAGLGQLVLPSEDTWSLEHLRAMVSGTKGYYARDYSVWLGWNNMRYIIEAAALHAKLLNRTLIIPSYVYVRSCEHPIDVCAMYSLMVNRGKYMGSDQWADRPHDEQMGWLMPIGVMLDMNEMRKQVPVVTVTQYLSLHGLPTYLETRNGQWDRDAYHRASTEGGDTVPLAVIPNERFDNNLAEMMRVDRLPSPLPPAPSKPGSIEATVHGSLLALTDKQHLIGLDVAQNFFATNTLETWKSEDGFVKILRKYGLGTVYTFSGLPSDFSKAIDNPTKYAAPFELMHGFVDDFSKYDEEVLFIEGELHADRKPAFMTFTSAKARDDYMNLVLRGVVHLPSVRMIADMVSKKMLEMNEGRMWMAAHWRRGDFVLVHWNNRTVEQGVQHIVDQLGAGRQRLIELREENLPQSSRAPWLPKDATFLSAAPPEPLDKWFVATDERNPHALGHARSRNAVLLSDLIESTPAMHRLLGWPILYGDVVALVEQEVLARSAFFFAFAYSSVSGGVVNIRTARGMDPRAMILEGT